jgi:hypothetical protein
LSPIGIALAIFDGRAVQADDPEGGESRLIGNILTRILD